MAFQALFKRKKTPEQVAAQLATDLRELSSHAPESKGLEKVTITTSVIDQCNKNCVVQFHWYRQSYSTAPPSPCYQASSSTWCPDGVGSMAILSAEIS